LRKLEFMDGFNEGKQNKGLLKTEKRPSPLGPDRKYYSLTIKGMDELKEFQTTWLRIVMIVNSVMGGDIHDEEG
jgi:DNA-binding PadR family transcriptional regulator